MLDKTMCTDESESILFAIVEHFNWPQLSKIEAQKEHEAQNR